MSKPQPLVVVRWIKENKSGIEPLSHIPVNSRYVGVVTQVVFGGDGKSYAAKIEAISESRDECERKADLVDEEIERTRNEVPSKRSRKKATTASTLATEKEVALASGMRPPIPKNLVAAKKQALRERRENVVHNARGQDSLDSSVMNDVRRSLNFSDSNNIGVQSDNLTEDESHKQSSSVATSRGEDFHESESDSDMDVSVNHVPVERSNDCSCLASQVLRKHDNPETRRFLQDLSCVFASDGTSGNGRRFLKLLPISDSVKKVELTAGKGIFIPLSDKQQITVDFADKPNGIIRETLFALYGRAAFQKHIITCQGSKPGTYGIEGNVLSAVLGFLNRHVSTKLKKSDLVKIINKRVGDWRKNIGTPPLKKAHSEFTESHSSKTKLVSSPRKRTPLKETEDISHLKVTPASPWKVTPSKETEAASPTKGSTSEHNREKKSSVASEQDGQGLSASTYHYKPADRPQHQVRQEQYPPFPYYGHPWQSDTSTGYYPPNCNTAESKGTEPGGGGQGLSQPMQWARPQSWLPQAPPPSQATQGQSSCAPHQGHEMFGPSHWPHSGSGYNPDDFHNQYAGNASSFTSL